MSGMRRSISVAEGLGHSHATTQFAKEGPFSCP